MKKSNIVLAVLLAGCGGSGSSPPPEEAPPPQPLADLFMAQVTTVVDVSSDDSEAPSVDSVVATAPDDREPEDL